jgi:hypothetical protein
LCSSGDRRSLLSRALFFRPRSHRQHHPCSVPSHTCRPPFHPASDAAGRRRHQGDVLRCADQWHATLSSAPKPRSKTRSQRHTERPER